MTKNKSKEYPVAIDDLLIEFDEFAKKLKEKFYDYEVWHYDGENEAWHDLQSEIDECVKEYENDN